MRSRFCHGLTAVIVATMCAVTSWLLNQPRSVPEASGQTESRRESKW